MNKATFIICMSITSYTYGATFIFDLDGVLVHKSNLRAGYQVGPGKFFGWYNPFKMKEKVFTFLDLIAPHDGSVPEYCYADKYMPMILCQWLMGTRSTQEIREFIENAFERYKAFFANERERELAYEIIMCIFTPERMARTIVPHKKGVKLLKKLYAQTDAQGNRLHKFYILSNWDGESFALVSQRKKLSKLFSKFDGYIISGYVGTMKPDPEIYKLVFNRYDISPDTELTIYLDDQWQNIKAAQSLGAQNLECIHCKNGKMKYAKKKLRELHII